MNQKYNENLESDLGNIDFAFKFLKLENNRKNMVYSPLSIKYALKTLYDGANGNTKAQIGDIIGAFDVKKYKDIENVLSFVNALYIRDVFFEKVNKDYIRLCLSKYDTKIKYDSFKNANAINNWIREKTFNQIKNMVEDNFVINSDMMLVNALALDMKWEEKFEAIEVQARKFYAEDGITMNVSTINKRTNSDSVSYYCNDYVTTLAVDLKSYNDCNLQFVGIMPKSDLSEYIDKFKSEELKNILDNLILASDTENGLDISIPKFSYDYALNLKADLQNLGIKEAFEEEWADFTGIVAPLANNIYVSNALHKANIKLSEKGIRATASTVIMMYVGSAIKFLKPIEVTIDKPFMYMIRDKKTGEIYFVGTVYTPILWKNDEKNYKYVY